MIFEAVHRKPVGTIVSARQENTLEFHPCVIIEHRDSEVQVSWVASEGNQGRASGYESQWIPRQHDLFQDEDSSEMNSKLLTSIEKNKLDPKCERSRKVEVDSNEQTEVYPGHCLNHY